ncbi:hypothetical protein TKK_0016161 [Trichogramma kaykai]|uniref:Integrase catalytic domain-containing protein n=1 Tax=Trichogramma kaykai TaxID=54128 RepID=A0ABD2W9W5_9HYME
MAFRRFCSKRGKPAIVYSDNDTNFKLMRKELAKAVKIFNGKKIHDHAIANKIDWKFNPSTASHMGGAWERLIRSVKVSLTVVLKGRSTTDEVSSTLLSEVEHAVNSRPLTHVSSNPHDREYLTPNHFIFGSSSGQLALPRYKENAINVREQWKLAQAYADEFWSQWLHEYLPTIQTRQKWQAKTPELKENDIVLIVDENVARNFWKKSVVIRVLPGKDGEIRVVEVRTASGLLRRPCSKLIKIA